MTEGRERTPERSDCAREGTPSKLLPALRLWMQEWHKSGVLVVQQS